MRGKPKMLNRNVKSGGKGKQFKQKDTKLKSRAEWQKLNALKQQNSKRPAPDDEGPNAA